MRTPRRLTNFCLPRKDDGPQVGAQLRAAERWYVHRHWLAIPSRSGAPHKDARPAIRPKVVEGYRERWDLLELPTTEVPLLFNEEVFAIAREYGPSDGHPGWPPLLRREGPGGEPNARALQT
jgi:hypothetical protein